jgi:division/cell wall cluster transcriptional repressor MraZ
MTRKKPIEPGQAGETASPVSLATLYSGYSHLLHAIDASNRIMLPSEWRGEGTPTRFFVIIGDTKDHLVVCPEKVFAEFLASLRAETADRKLIVQMERVLNECSKQVSLDRFGRLPLPSDFLARTRIEKKGKLFGRFSKFEIWPHDKSPDTQAEQDQAAAMLAEKLQYL